ncbi:hypothetical protein GCM10007967_18770 [Xylanimonas ulmi]|uniref:AraC-like protein n=2 Tax=Xylanimonas ulmi TaxID=228973 RepID=A0A4Q7M6H2_9MICO|nr:AraC-like protein [Xylanibacterium ulmi]
MGATEGARGQARPAVSGCASIDLPSDPTGQRSILRLAGGEGLRAFAGRARDGSEQDGFRAQIVAGRYGPVDLCALRYTPHQLASAGVNFGHSYPVSRLLIMLEGGGTVWIGEHTIELGPGGGALLPGNLPVRYEVTETSSRIQLDLPADDPVFANHLQDVSLAHWQSRHFALEGLAAYGQALLRYDGSKASWAERAQARRGLEALALETVASAPSLDEVSRQSPRGFALDYIRRHFADPALTPQSVARAAGVSLRTMQRAFTGERSIAEWIAHYRLDHALALLRDERLSMLTNAEIAIRSGYGSTTSMRRAVALATGYSPTTYQRLHASAERE